MTTYWYWGFPLSGSLWVMFANVVTPIEMQDLNSNLQIIQDPNKGTIVAVAFDCSITFAPGVTVTLDDEDAGVTENDVSGTRGAPTDTSGTVYFQNVPVGQRVVTATPPGDRGPSSRVIVDVRPGAITVALLFPAPGP